MPRMPLRPVLLAALLPVLLGTTCITMRSVRVQPVAGLAPVPAPEVLFDSVHATMSRWVLERGYVLPDSARHRATGPIEWCAFRPRGAGPGICWSSFEGAIVVDVSQRGGFRLDAHADSLQREITALLADRFGAEAVRRCEWRTEVDRARSRWWSTKTRSACVAKDTTARSRR